MDKKEVKEIAKLVTEEFINSEEFKSIIQSSVDYGFYAGLRCSSRIDVVELLYAKDAAFEDFWKTFTKIKGEFV
jgi:hypothetical protein